MKKRVKWMLGGLALAAVLIQFANPARTNPPVEPGHDLLATNPPPLKVAALLHAACYDCHSYETKLPWYGRVAPVSWWLNGHIKDARKRLNFSNWPHDRPQRVKSKLENISEQVGSGDMPLRSYTWIHAASRLSAEDRKLIVQWADKEAERLKSSVTELQKSSEEK